MTAMHQDYDICSVCQGEDPDCWLCKGAGVVEHTDNVRARMEQAAKSLQDGRCPHCGRFARVRKRDGDRPKAIWCRRCDRGFVCMERDDVLKRPQDLAL